ncbi:MAG: MFS transporter [Chloroflexota bacterium]|nr:MFS transporter [Chloroflexota bacterium]
MKESSSSTGQQREPVPPGEVVATAPLHRPLFYWSLPFTFLQFGLPIYGKMLGASALEIGGLFSVFTATTLLLRPLVGWAVDRFGRKRFLVLALSFYALAMVTFAWARSLCTLYLARFIQGIGSSFFWISVNTIVADLTPPEGRGRALGRIAEITSRGGLVGVAVGFALTSLLSERVGWQIAFSIYALMTAVGTWLAWRDVSETRPSVSARMRFDYTLSRALITLLTIVFVTGASEAMLGPIYLVYLQEKFTTDIYTLAWAFLPAGLVSAFLSERLGQLGDRFGRVRMMALGMAASGLLSLLLPISSSLVLLAILYTLTVAVWAISVPAQTAVVADLAGVERLGVGYGLYDMISSGGYTIGPLLGGTLYDTMGQEIPFYLSGGVLLAGCLAALVFLRPLAYTSVIPDCE